MGSPVDPYEILGVARTATDKEIRRAYRRRAKETHPDVTGKRREFEAVNNAQLVLLDPKRRSQYDTTGHYDEWAPDNEQAKLLEMLSVVIDMALNSAQQRRQEPQQSDFIALMRDVIRNGKRKHDEEIQLFRDGIKHWDKLVGRFRVKEGPNQIDTIVRGKVSQLNMMIASAEEHKKALDGVSAMIAGYTFDREKLPDMPTHQRTSGNPMIAIMMKEMLR